MRRVWWGVVRFGVLGLFPVRSLFFYDSWLSDRAEDYLQLGFATSKGREGGGVLDIHAWP